jgi:hypothetical protein
MRIYLTDGDVVQVRLPYSEVCMHMKVADKVMGVRLVEGHMAQLLNRDGSPFSFPITAGEAGLHFDPATRTFYAE